MIIALRTDSTKALLSLLSPSGKIIQSKDWEAGRQLSVQLPAAIDQILSDSDATFDDLTGIIVYEGPGSFTGLRIGITIVNAVAHEQNIPIVGSTGDNWIDRGLEKLIAAKPGVIVMPVYGGEANITKPKK